MMDICWPFWCKPPIHCFVLLTYLQKLSVQPATKAAVGGEGVVRGLPKHLSVDWWSGRSFTWPALLWRSAIQGSASALSGPHVSTPRCHLHAFLHRPFKLRRLLHQGCTKTPGVFGMDVASVHFGAALLLYLDLVKSPHPPPSTAPLDARGWLYNALSLPIMFLTSPFQFSRGTGRSQNGKLPPCIGRHRMIIMAS